MGTPHCFSLRIMDYNEDYYYRLLRIQAKTGEQIARIRWDFVQECNPRVVLDYGCGVSFFKAYAAPDVIVDTYDIMPVIQTGVKHRNYDLVCFWDVLEHVNWKRKPDKKIENILTRTKNAAVAVPVLPKNQNPRTWKHTKPGEHLSRFEKIEEVIWFFEKRKFKCLKIGTPECPPREDIYNFLFEAKR